MRALVPACPCGAMPLIGSGCGQLPTSDLHLLTNGEAMHLHGPGRPVSTFRGAEARSGSRERLGVQEQKRVRGEAKDWHARGFKVGNIFPLTLPKGTPSLHRKGLNWRLETPLLTFHLSSRSQAGLGVRSWNSLTPTYDDVEKGCV